MLPRYYLNVVLGNPSFSKPIRAALFEEGGIAWLIWSRRRGMRGDRVAKSMDKQP